VLAIVLLPILLAIIAVIVIMIGVFFLKMTRSKNESLPIPPPPPPNLQQATNEAGAKVKCAYCGILFDESIDRCPNCGATH